MEAYTVYDILKEITLKGRSSAPRGEVIKELNYFQGQILFPWSSYKARNYSSDYFKREFLWYLNADPYDQRICKFAKMWEKISQKDGRIFSNYGYYWFGPQNGFQWVVDTLRADPDSRQAYIPMNSKEHAFKGNLDFVCTKGIQFRIINEELWIHVSMRSSDAIYGLGTDLPCFWTLWTMVAVELGMPLGRFIFSSDSVHVYEKHFKMVAKILEDGPFMLREIGYPVLASAQDLITGEFKSRFGRWLTRVSLDDETN